MSPGYLLKRSALFLPFMAIPFIGFTQASLGTLPANLPAIANMQSTIPVKVVVQNTGNAVFNGAIDILYNVDATIVLPDVFLTSFTPSAPFNPGDKDSTNTNMLIDHVYFNKGDNIVVVWSTGNGIFTTYHSWDTIYVDSVVSVGDPLDINSCMNLYPNPASSALTVELNTSQYVIECVRILSLLGEEMQNISKTVLSARGKMKIDISMLNPGVYVLECMDSEGNLGRKKFIKYSD